MRIVGFLQVRNEIDSGHLQRFLDVNSELVDHLYAYDDASDDGTYERLSSEGATVIKGATKRFGQELFVKSILLEKIKASEPEGTAILWLDADEVLMASRAELEILISNAFNSGFDGIQLPHINLWRSESWFRTDNLYDDLTPVRIWQLSEKLYFPKKIGLHQQMWPVGISAVKRLSGPSVVHYGFASTELIIRKYANYRLHWQSGAALHRLINEQGRQLEPISTRERVIGERFQSITGGESEPEPKILSSAEWYGTASSEIRRQKASSKPRVTLACLIYSSTSWLEFQYAELLRLQRDLPDGDVDILFVANDATSEVKEFLRENGIPHIVATTKASEDEWFINSVYRAYNLAVQTAKTDYVLLVNSDMAYAPGSLTALLEEAKPSALLASRLVEMGVMPTGLHGIERNFGTKPRNFRRSDFVRYAKKISRQTTQPGGLFMPLLVHRETFLKLGGYPEGNILEHDLAIYLAGGTPRIAKPGEKSVTGDKAFTLKADSAGVEHLTVFDSIAYHFQAGERRDKRKSQARSGFAIVNDSLDGINGEKVLWRQLEERLKKEGFRVGTIATGFPRSVIASALNPVRLWLKSQLMFRTGVTPRVVFSNATWQIPLWGTWRSIVIRQDSPSGFAYRTLQKLTMKYSDLVIANDSDFVAANAHFNIQWLLIPLGEYWWQEPDASEDKQQKTAIFVGAFNEIKGWSSVRELILNNPSVRWTVVSKYENDDPGFGKETPDNVTIYRCLDQVKLRTLIRSSAVLVMASPYETQNLASLEAASQGTVVATTVTGFLGSFGLGQHQFGYVDNNLENALTKLFEPENTFEPRRFIADFGLLGEVGWDAWLEVFQNELKNSFLDLTQPGYLISFMRRLANYIVWLQRRFMRNLVVPFAIKIKRTYFK